MDYNLGAIILSAGYSSRMNGFKPLLPVQGEYAVKRCIDLFKNAGIHNIVTVTGYRSDELVPFLREYNSDYGINENFKEGMYSSAVCGIQKLIQISDISAFFLLPVDICAIKVCTVQKLMHIYEENPNHIIYPSFDSEKGHPPLIPSAFISEIMESKGRNFGIRGVLENHKDVSVDVNVPDRGIALDMDTKDDYKEICNYARYSYAPDDEEIKCIYEICSVPPNVIEHCMKVAELSEKITTLLNGKGTNLDVHLIKNSALLHDIAKGQTNHSLIGKNIMQQYGYPKVGDIIGEHMDINLESDDRISEKEIVYLCDKMVKGTKIVTIEERFDIAKEKFKNKPDIIAIVFERIKKAAIIKSKVEKILGIKIEKLNL